MIVNKHPFATRGAAMIAATVSILCSAQSARAQLEWINLDSDIPGVAKSIDPHLINPWGLVPTPGGGAYWVADNATGVATLYNNFGVPANVVVTIPAPVSSGTAAIAAPTGVVVNHTSLTPASNPHHNDFSITENSSTEPAQLLFATEDGTICGYAPSVDGAHAIIAVDNSGAGAVYKGLAEAFSGGQHQLYACNFHAGTVDVFNAQFQPITVPGGFADPNAVSGFAPFNIKRVVVGATTEFLYVTYAQQDLAKHDDTGTNGYINVFRTDGTLIKRLAGPNTNLNSPWGMAYNHLRNQLLVGNNGSGLIVAFDATSVVQGQPGAVAGNVVVDRRKAPLQFQNLWALHFGREPEGFFNVTNLLDLNDLREDDFNIYCAAGIVGESHGLVSRIFRRDLFEIPALQ